MTTSRESSDDAALIAGSPMWQRVEPHVIHQLVEDSDIIRLSPGDQLFQPGERYGQRVFIHLEGELQQTSTSGETRTAAPGDLVGLANYLDGDSYRSGAVALSECRVLSVPATAIQRLEHESAEFFEAINRALASRMRRALQVRETVRGTLARPVRNFMHSGLPTCTVDTTAAQAARLLGQRQLASLGVTDDDGRLLGLVTPTGLLLQLANGDIDADSSLRQAQLEQAQTVTPDTPLWRVEELQRRHPPGDVVVVDQQRGLPLGFIAPGDLVQALSNPPYTLESEIRGAPDVETLKALRERVPVAAQGIHEAHRSAGAAVRALTDMHLALQHRLVELVLRDMRTSGLGAAPNRFAVIIMGSGGRGEMLLRPDQDNGLIIDDQVDEEGLEWFQAFAERLNPALAEIGYHLCPGNVMARNPDYRRTLQGWQGKLSRLVASPGRQEARLANIVLDFATLYGDDRLTTRLRSHLNAELREDRGKLLFRMMVSDNRKVAQPLGWFNRLVTAEHRGSRVIDLKRTGLRILIDAMRVFALREGVSRCMTLERIAALRRLGVFEPDFSETMRIAFEELQDLLLSHQLDQIRRGETPDPLLRMERLSSHQRERLRVALRASRRMREHLQLTFGLVLH